MGISMVIWVDNILRIIIITIIVIVITLAAIIHQLIISLTIELRCKLRHFQRYFSLGSGACDGTVLGVIVLLKNLDGYALVAQLLQQLFIMLEKTSFSRLLILVARMMSRKLLLLDLA